MKLKIRMLLTAILLLTVSSVWAKQTITGKVVDANDNSPVCFANILLMKSDSTFITGTTSDLDGNFEFTESPEEPCLLSVTFMGYQPEFRILYPAESNEMIEIELKHASIILSEVTIKAQSLIIKDDRKIIYPTEEQLRNATDGTDIIRKMQLPSVMVDPVSGEITMSGNAEVQLRINGVQVTYAEVAAIPPTDIVRIEYHDDPGVRYGNVDAVIDYITRRKESGGNVNSSLMHSFIDKNKMSIDDRISAKFNYGKSEYSLNAMYIQRKSDWTREYDEKLIFPDHELHRIEIGEPTPFDKRIFTGNFNYSLAEKDKYFFNVQFSYLQNDFPNGFDNRKTKLYSSDYDTPLSIIDQTVEKTHSPALDIYLQRNLKNNQLLIFNVVGTYIDTDIHRIYQEKRENIFVTDIHSVINGDRYSIIGESIYENKIGKGKVTGGIRHHQSYTNNKYSGTTIADVSMRHAESYLYAEFQSKAGKLGYMVNFTGVRLNNRQNKNQTGKYAFQPSARITFEPVKNLSFRYRIHVRNEAPSLSAMNNVEQRIDSWQVRRGNPDLQTYRTLNQTLMAGYLKGVFGIDLQVSYDYEFNPIMESVFYEGGTFVRTFENQRSFQNLNAEATLKIRPWKDHISLSVSPRADRYISKGNNYIHTYNMFDLRVNFDFSYNNWLASFSTVTPPRFMYGEQMTKSDQMYIIMAGYKQEKWSLMIGAKNLFSDEYKTDNRNWAEINPVVSKIHTSHSKSFIVKLTFNLNYGKQLKGDRKRINNTDTDTGIMQGIK